MLPDEQVFDTDQSFDHTFVLDNVPISRLGAVVERMSLDGYWQISVRHEGNGYHTVVGYK